MKTVQCLYSLVRIAAAGCLALVCQAQAHNNPAVAVLATSDTRIELSAGATAPRLLILSGGSPAWHNRQEEALPSSIELGGAEPGGAEPGGEEPGGAALPIHWRLQPGLGTTDAHRVVFVYESRQPHLRLRWIWEARAGFGPLEHSITVENLSGRAIWLPMLDSLRLAWDVKANTQLRNLYVEKGADTPSAHGTHLEGVDEDYRWTGTSSTYALPIKREPREIIPAEFVYTALQPQQGWYAGIEFSGRTRIHLERSGSRLTSVLGLNPEPGPFRTRLAPGGSFETPAVFLGAFSGGPDGAGNQLRPWVRAVLGNPLTWNDPHYPLTVNNSWGSGMEVDEQLALRMIAQSRELGLEMFHLDAGWFRGVGDWYPDPRKFPHGLAYVADAAHRQGLRFGIWVDWTQAGLDTEPGALNVHNPQVHDWLVANLPPNWKPQPFKGQTVDLGVPAAHGYLGREVNRIIEDYRLDMLEHDGYLVAKGCVREDHPHAPPDRSTMKVIHDWGSDFVMADNSTDVSYHAVRAYYDIYARARREHPGLLFEICNDGGRMVDFGSAAHGDYFSITDTYDPLSNRRAFYDASYVLPPAMLESYVEKWPTPHPENFLYMLRSGMMGWITIMTDTTAWTPAQHEAARQAIALYRKQLRPLIRDARLYHVSPRPDGVHWDGMEYWDPARGEGVVFAFRGSVADEDQHRFVLAGLDPAQRYRLHFQDGSAPDREATGRELMGPGLAVERSAPFSSELVWIALQAGQPRAPAKP